MAQNTVIKVFVQRDYSRGTNCRFMTEMPVELNGKIDEQAFQHTIQGINEIMDDAEKIGPASYFENCLGCLTGYLSLLCFETHYNKCLKRLSEYINQQNTNVFVPLGLMLTNPMDRGLRVVSF
ncbi:golgin subfamily A member 7-like isoform X2 [Dendronephthya gigantea]|uniref:golgin subfamily A member 7-like isoform X2 n=1 Tax=Dendronephthya gigantea TaxID=151771 RepID=UPI001069873D|nr:golgin subfamily A member 7-like isoform X2 [Dendronephthya gigantea]